MSNNAAVSRMLFINQPIWLFLDVLRAVAVLQNTVLDSFEIFGDALYRNVKIIKNKYPNRKKLQKTHQMITGYRASDKIV